MRPYALHDWIWAGIFTRSARETGLDSFKMGAGDRIFSKEQLERGMCNEVSATRARTHTHTHNTQEQFERGMRNIVSATKGEIQRDSNKEQCKNREKYKIERKVNECDKTACTCGLRPHVLVAQGLIHCSVRPHVLVA